MGAEVPATTDAKAQLLDANRDAYVAKSSAEEFTWMRRQIDLIRQGESLKAAAQGGSSIRDRSMAENIKWILDQQPAGTKMVVWAHNGHVTTEAMSFAPEGTMGVHLRRMFGDALRVFGFAFNSGKFQAVKMGAGLIQHTAPPAHAGSFDATLSAAGVAPVFALDLHHAPAQVQHWLDAPLEHREAGAVYDASRDSNYWMRIHPAQAFDAIFFVNEMTSARARSGSGAPNVPPPPPAKAAFNLDFEQGPTGQQPAGWSFPQQGNGFKATTENQACAGGWQCGHVVREKPTDTPAASLAQRIDATPYRGKTIRFRAKVRSKLTPLSSARLWLRVDLGDGKGMGYFNNMSDHDPGALADWTPLEITGPVAEDADAVAFGLLFVGDGEAWIDDASIEIVNTP
jgi:erythromycin esterase